MIVNGENLLEDFRILKSEIVSDIRGASTQADITGILFGICNGNLTAVEIAEALVANPDNPNERIPIERTMRMVRVIGAVDPRGPDANTSALITRNGSPVMEFNTRWTFHNPEGWNFFLFNNTGNTMTTGALHNLWATHYGVWVT